MAQNARAETGQSFSYTLSSGHAEGRPGTAANSAFSTWPGGCNPD